MLFSGKRNTECNRAGVLCRVSEGASLYLSFGRNINLTDLPDVIPDKENTLVMSGSSGVLLTLC